jgi:hypothetical protein
MTQQSTEPKIGDKMPDGTVYAGISPDTSKPMYTTPADAPMTMTTGQASQYAEGLNSRAAHGHKDWDIPSKAELKVLFNNRAAIGGFDESSKDPGDPQRSNKARPGWYWAKYGPRDHGDALRFRDGLERAIDDCDRLSVRCVRR